VQSIARAALTSPEPYSRLMVALSMSAFRRKADHLRYPHQCPLMSQSGRRLLRVRSAYCLGKGFETQ
jgi:hypothetical protein